MQSVSNEVRTIANLFIFGATKSVKLNAVKQRITYRCLETLPFCFIHLTARFNSDLVACAIVLKCFYLILANIIYNYTHRIEMPHLFEIFQVCIFFLAFNLLSFKIAIYRCSINKSDIVQDIDKFDIQLFFSFT